MPSSRSWNSRSCCTSRSTETGLRREMESLAKVLLNIRGGWVGEIPLDFISKNLFHLASPPIITPRFPRILRFLRTPFLASRKPGRLVLVRNFPLSLAKTGDRDHQCPPLQTTTLVAFSPLAWGLFLCPLQDLLPHITTGQVPLPLDHHLLYSYHHKDLLLTPVHRLHPL